MGGKMSGALNLCLLLLLCLLPVGCYDYSEPDEKAWVLAMGLDKGRQNVLTVTAVVAVPKNIAGGSGGEPAAGGAGGGTFVTVSMEAPTLLSSLELLNAMIDRQADLSHTKWFVFSRELAEESISAYYAPISRFHQFRRSTHVVVCEGRAEEFLDRGRPSLEDNVGKFYELQAAAWEYTEFIPFDTFHHFLVKSKTPGVAPVTALAALNRKEPVYENNAPKPKGEFQAGRIPRRGGGEIELMGGAVFVKGRMVGTLSADQMGVTKIFFDTFKRTLKDVPDPFHPDKYVILDIRPRVSPRVTVRIGEDGLPEISARVSLEGSIISIQSGEMYEQSERQAILERAVEKNMLDEINQTIAKSQSMGADILGLGLHAKKLFLTWPQWEAYNWDEKYPDAIINVSVDFNIRRAGLTHETVPLR